MKLVRIIRNYDQPILRQTPACMGIWDDIQFTLDEIKVCDYAIVLNAPSKDTSVQCFPEHIWAIIQEPPIKEYTQLHQGNTRYRVIYTSNDNVHTNRHIQSQPAIPWWIQKDYDFLSKCKVPHKTEPLSWITSNLNWLEGHRKRMAFLELLKKKVNFHLYGRGFTYIEDKWDGLAPYKYSLAIENFSNAYYWSEKIIDCFLAWTMPIYYGCTQINEFFPPESMVCIDINDPDVTEKISSVLKSDLWERNIDAIAKARSLVLQKYQLFPFLAEKIRLHEVNCKCKRRKHTALPIFKTPQMLVSLKERAHKLFKPF
jgi:hypothetical protein